MSQRSDLSEIEVREIVERVRRRLVGAGDVHPGAALRAAAELSGTSTEELGDGIHASIDEAVAAAGRAFAAYGPLGLARRKVIIAAVREAMLDASERLAQLAHAETKIGRAADKVVKNRLVATKAPGPEDLEVEAVTGDHGMMVTEFAPFGVVAAITPVTNPTSTVINNTISIVSAGNAVVFNAHPSARRCSAETVRLINRAIVAAGGATRPGGRGRRAHHRERSGPDEPPRRPGPAGDRGGRAWSGRRSRRTSGRSRQGPATRQPWSTPAPMSNEPGATSCAGRRSTTT